MLVSWAVFHLVADGQGFLGKALFGTQWVQGMMAWQGVDGTQKHKIPRERQYSGTSGSGTRQLEGTEQSHKYTKDPRAFAHAIPSV